MKLPRVAVVLFTAPGSRVLMHRRRDPQTREESWLFVGGAIRDRESEEDAAVREIQEELGYSLKHITFFRSYPADEWSGGVEVFLAPFPGLDAFRLTKEGDMRPNLELLSLEDAKKLPMIPVARAILEDFGIHQKGVL